MDKDGNDLPQSSGYTGIAFPHTSAERVSSESDGMVSMLRSWKYKNPRNLRQDSLEETDENKFPLENVPVLSEKNGPVNTREVKLQNKTNDENRRFVIKLQKRIEVGKENQEVNSSSEPVPSEHFPRGQVNSGNRYKTNSDFKHKEISRDTLVEKTPSRLHTEVLLSQQKKVQLEKNTKKKSNLSEIIYIKEDEAPDAKFSSETNSLPNDKNCGKQNVTCIITKKICPFDHQSSHPGPYIVTFGQPGSNKKPIELILECFYCFCTTDALQPHLAQKAINNSIDSKQEGRCSNVTDTKYSKQIYSFTLEEQCLEDNAADQNSPYKSFKPQTVQNINTSQILKAALEKSKLVNKPNNICSTISQTNQKSDSIRNQQNEVCLEANIVKHLELAPRNDHSYVRSFCGTGNSKEKQYHSKSKSPICPLSEVSSSNLWSQGGKVNNTEHSPFQSTEVNLSNNRLQVKEEQNHNEDFWGFYTLMNIGALLPKLPVKGAETIENNNLYVPPKYLSEETSSSSDDTQ